MNGKEFFMKKYSQKDPWNYGGCPYEKIRHSALGELAMELKPGKVLDLGCGEGHFLYYLLSQYPELKVTGVEFISEAARRCRKRLREFKARIVTSHIVDFLMSKEGEEYHVVVCGDVLNFLSFEEVHEQVVPLLRKDLKDEGGIIISYSNVNNQEWIVDLFNQSFFLNRQVYIEPLAPPPPFPWVVSQFVKGK